MISSSYGEPLQNGLTHDDVVVGEQDPLAVDELGLDGGAQDAAALEPAEGPLLLEDLARHERQTEQLTVGVGERGAGLAAVVDDRLRVADVGVRWRAAANRRCSTRIMSAASSSVRLCAPPSWSGV